MANILAPVVDLNKVRLEGVCPPHTERNSKSRPLKLKLFGVKANKDLISLYLSEYDISFVANVEIDFERDEEGNSASAHDPYFSIVDLSAVIDLSTLPAHEALPETHVTSPLLHHQLQALQWCISRESPSLPHLVAGNIA
jgi:hypothetical protein